MGRRAIPEAVGRRARAAGGACARWLERLDSLVAALEEDWSIRVGEAFSGGTDAFVAPAVRADGTECVLRLCMPDDSAREDLLRADSALLVADGRGCARLLREDPERLACLLERLGRPLDAVESDAGRRLDILCETLAAVWSVPVSGHDRAALLPDGGGAAGWFRSFIPSAWERLGKPLPRAAVDHALSCLDGCESRLGSGEAVLVHGDANAPNCLEDPLRPGCFRFIDPDGLLAERACDLGVLMIAPQEGFADDALSIGESRCRRLQERTGVDPAAIWQWGCVQSVSTALVCREIGHPAASALRRIAVAWSGAEPFR